MGIFDRFKRNKQTEVLPEEVEQYYQSKQNEKRSIAWLVGLGTLVATVVIAAGLFYGARYAYRQIKGDDNNTAQQQTSPESSVNQNDSAPSNEGGPAGDTNGSTNSSTRERNSSPSDSEESSRNSNRTSPPTGNNLPSSGDRLPATGDPGQ